MEEVSGLIMAAGKCPYGLGHSCHPAQFPFGLAAALALFPFTRIRAISDIAPAARQLLKAFQDSSKGLLIIGILLAGAQIMVAMINMTGLGITFSSMVVSIGGDNTYLIAFIVACVCMLMGMGIPTTAAYVLVAAALAPALIKIGIAPIIAHLFVFYYATLSVITPPVCIAVFVGAGIAETKWTAAAKYALKLGAVTYVIPFLFIIYPGMLAQAGVEAFLRAAFSGVIFIFSFANLFGGFRVSRFRPLDVMLWVVVAILAILPGLWTSMAALAITVGLYLAKRFQCLQVRTSF